MRGEHEHLVHGQLQGEGSSPRARGARAPVAPGRGRGGIIPACAGSTRGFFTPWALPRDHPRVRGEHDGIADAVIPAGGSSPRARGAPVRAALSAQTRGIIPACAGSTNTGRNFGTCLEDHPRVRGEHALRTPRIQVCAGSSPRARGAPDRARPPTRSTGIIPACAGSTPACAGSRRQQRDHPRVRGEHIEATLQVLKHEGSSPRARGAPAHLAAGAKGPGIIPACAGSTPSRSPASRLPTDHPRVRGEHNSRDATAIDNQGSSPRARGARAGLQWRSDAGGIIPACAGSTGQTRTSSRAGRDHPRVRGEHRGAPVKGGGVRGSSPRARGAQIRNRECT